MLAPGLRTTDLIENVITEFINKPFAPPTVSTGLIDYYVYLRVNILTNCNDLFIEYFRIVFSHGNYY